MAQHNAAPTDVTQSHSATKSDKRHMDVFKRRMPLTFSPKRQYGLAVISPLQKHDSRETVFADDSTSGTSSPAHSNDALEEFTFERPRRRRQRSSNMTRVQPFSFDGRDSIQRVQREELLQEVREMRQMQEQQWSSSFRAHPVRRYKPHIRPKDHSRPVHNSLNNV